LCNSRDGGWLVTQGLEELAEHLVITVGDYEGFNRITDSMSTEF
jgi:hypothetical protein